MTFFGTLLGAAESNDPKEIAKSGLMGGAAQVAFNVGEAILNKLKLPGGKIMGVLVGSLHPISASILGKRLYPGKAR
jgi:hypothetical protein